MTIDLPPKIDAIAADLRSSYELAMKSAGIADVVRESGEVGTTDEMIPEFIDGPPTREPLTIAGLMDIMTDLLGDGILPHDAIVLLSSDGEGNEYKRVFGFSHGKFTTELPHGHPGGVRPWLEFYDGDDPDAPKDGATPALLLWPE